MNGPARLDLLIPLTRPHTSSPQAKDSFEDLLRRDESRLPRHMQDSARQAPVEEAGPAAQNAAQSSETPSEVPERIERQEDDMPVMFDGSDHAAQLERVYAVHLAAGGYLSIRPSGEGSAEAALHASASTKNVTVTARTPITGGEAPQDRTATTTPTEATPAAGGFTVGTGGERSVSMPPIGGRAVLTRDASGPQAIDAPLWLPDIARMSTSSDGLVTLWIRDFGASRYELADRVMQMLRRAREAGVNIGTVVVNGQPWSNENHGKGE